MNSFDSRDDLSLLKSFNPTTGRPEPTDDLILSAIQRPEGKAKRFSFGGRPRITWGLAGTALAACVALALVVTNLPSQESGYLFSTAGSAGSKGMAASAQSDAIGTSVAKSAAASIMMPAFNLAYTASPELSDAAGNGHIYQIIEDGDAKAIAETLAKYFEIDGGITLKDDGGDWVEYVPTRDTLKNQPEQGWLSTHTSFWASKSPGYLGFGYNDNAAFNWSTCQEPITPLPAGCADIKKEALPTLAEAKAEAGKLMAALGIKWGNTVASTPSGGYVLDAQYQDQASGLVAYAADAVTSDQPAADQPTADAKKTEKSILVNASLVVEGAGTPVQIQFTWMPGYSNIASVYGELGRAVDKGTFDTISAKDTVARLNNYGYSGQVHQDWQNLKWSTKTYGNMTESLRARLLSCSSGLPVPIELLSTARPTGDASSAPVAGPSATAAECDLPMRDGIPQLNATVTRAESTSLMIWDSSNGRWLVPGYNFYDETGYLGSAFSVVDGVIKIEAPSNQPMTK